jgi:acyl-CoA thioesterase
MTTRFDTDTAITPIGPGQFEANLDPGWWIVRGPNGGYIAAILVNALAMAVDDAARELRSITIHYLRPPAEGRAQVETAVERSGRTLTSVTARMHQDGVLQALAIAAFATGRDGPDLHHNTMPEVAPPEACALMSESHIPIHHQYEHRFAVGPNFFEGEQTPHAISGGWLRLREGRPLDAALLVAYTDAWPPAVFASSELPPALSGVPTIDLTVHIRAQALSRVGPVDPVLVVFRTREVRDGYLEEDGEIWSRDGELLAHSRQLGLML